MSAFGNAQGGAPLADETLEIPPGRFIVLAGPSGSGKSRLCRRLAGLTEPTAGGSYIAGDPDNQLFCSRLWEDMVFGPLNLGHPVTDLAARVEAVLQDVGLAGFAHRRPETLSGGEAQRAVLASFLMLATKVLILDQALDQVDPGGRQAIYRLLLRCCRAQGRSVVLVENRIGEILDVADRLVFLTRGGTAYDGPPAGLPAALRHLIEWPLAPARPRQAQGGAPLVGVQGLVYRHPGSGKGLDGVDLTIRAGEFVALTGENGAGKTTLLRHLAALLHPQAGRVQIGGNTTKDLKPHHLADQVGYLQQQPENQLFCDTVGEEIAFGLKIAGTPAGPTARRVAQLMADFGLTPFAQTHPYRLEPALRQMTALAAALVRGPKLLLLDEPISRQHLPRAHETMSRIDKLHRAGLTVVLVTHDEAVAARYATRVVRLANGKIVNDSRNPLAP